jgi:hypothetical protein
MSARRIIPLGASQRRCRIWKGQTDGKHFERSDGERLKTRYLNKEQLMSGRHDPEDIPEVRPVYRSPSPDLGDDAAVRMLLPVGRSGWAIVSGYLGLVSVLCLPAPFALLTGILAIRDMRRNPKLHGMGRAVFGIIMGSLGTIGLLFGLFGLIASRFAK